MDITYFDDGAKEFEIEYVSQIDPDHWAAEFIGFHADFICHVLNGKYWELLGHDDKSVSEWQEINAPIEDLLEPKDKCNGSNPYYIWIEQSINNLDMENYKKLIELVLLDKKPGLTAAQRMLAYESSLDHRMLRSFDAKVNYNFFTTEEYKNPLVDDGKPTFEQALDIIKGNKIKTEESISYQINSFQDLFNIVLYKAIKEDDFIKKCPNCGKYFYPGANSNMIYCSNTSPQDKSKTCGEYRKYINYLNKSHNDEATKLYKQIYNNKANKYKRTISDSCPDGNQTLKADLDSFTSQGALWRSSVKSGEKSNDEFVSWLKLVKKGVLNGSD